MQNDPVGYKDDLDLYTYVANDPTDQTDPTGTEIGQKYNEPVRDPNLAPNEAMARAAEQQFKADPKAYLQQGSNKNFGPGTNKCNEFVADTASAAGLTLPMVPLPGILGRLGFMRDATAAEIANPNVHIEGWSTPHPMSQARRGDIVGQSHHGGRDGHTGVTTGPGHTISVSSKTTPAGVLVNNNWGYRKGDKGPGEGDPVARSYTGP